MGSQPAPPAQHWSRYRGNVARHLIGISGDLQARVRLRLAEEHGFAGLRPSFGPLLSLIWREGLPPGALAAELAISKQACSQLVGQVEAAGYLERIPNPDDGRSRLARLTPAGRAVVEAGVEVILAIEAEYADAVGAAAYRRFTASLAALYKGLGIPSHANVALIAQAGRSAGMLPLVAVRIERELMEAALGRGHTGLKMSHSQVLPQVGPRGRRIGEIARIQRVSRQAISATSRDLEAQGYLRRDADPVDGRGVVLRLSARGERLIADSVAAVDRMERRFRGLLGAARFDALSRVARELYCALEIEPPGEPGEIEALAANLQQRLGREGAARLAELLEGAGPAAG